VIKKLLHLILSPKTYWGTKASGIMFICLEDETILLLKRSNYVEQPNTWGITGGAVNEGFFKTNHKEQDPSNSIFLESARRETQEELGNVPETNLLIHISTYKDKDFTYKTFIYGLGLKEKNSFDIKLNHEHSEYKWFKFDELPKNLHFGVKYTLKELGL